MGHIYSYILDDKYEFLYKKSFVLHIINKIFIWLL